MSPCLKQNTKWSSELTVAWWGSSAHCSSTHAELSLSAIPIPASESLPLLTFCLNHSDLGCLFLVICGLIWNYIFFWLAVQVPLHPPNLHWHCVLFYFIQNTYCLVKSSCLCLYLFIGCILLLACKFYQSRNMPEVPRWCLAASALSTYSCSRKSCSESSFMWSWIFYFNILMGSILSHKVV